MRAINRFELKYRVDPQRCLQLKNALAPYITADDYTKKSAEGHYLVRSLYFDTFDYAAFNEKDEGDYGRIKLRIRSYSDRPDDNARLSVELKTRHGNDMNKFSTFVSLSDYSAFMDNLHWPDAGDAVLMEFERLLHIRAYRPKTIVEYHREGYVARDCRPLRITFDYNVRSAAADGLFPANPFFRPHPGDDVVFEIKCGMKQPSWLTRIVRKYGLELVSNSKYAQSIILSRPDASFDWWRPALPDGRTVHRIPDMSVQRFQHT